MQSCRRLFWLKFRAIIDYGNANSGYKDGLVIEEEKLSRSQLAEKEPRLNELLWEALSVIDPGGQSFCANDVFYSTFKQRIIKLVGFDAESAEPALRTMHAYQLAYHKIYLALPECRGCMCLL